jgi:dihydropteroate synthase
MNSKIKFPLIMGIVNVTPDSFSDGGNFFSKERAIEHALLLTDQGADIIDIGGESTRPGANEVSELEEINRVVPVISEIKRIKPDIKISIDTTKYNVALESVKAGADIINDISGLTFEPRLAEIAAEYDKELIIMHINGQPRTMQANPHYENVVKEVFDFLLEKIKFAKNIGVKKIISDIGIGFGKNLNHNLTLLQNIEKFKELEVPILLGISRKSFINHLLQIESPEDRDLPTLLIHTMLLSKNIDIIRVHNVKNIILLKKLHQAIHN